jgi:hypothetical protein
MSTLFSNAPAAREALRRALKSAFQARDLADPLLPLEATLPTSEARRILQERNRLVAGVVRTGDWLGWVGLEDLQDEGTCGERARPFDSQPLLSEESSLREVILALGRSDPVFVRSLGEVTAVLTTADLQEAPMRMWLFGLVTLSEFLMTRMLERQFPENRWREFLSEGRLEQARALQAERLRRGQQVPLRECLQFGDKADILLKQEHIRVHLGLGSRRKGQEFFRRMEALRNCLAHTQLLPTEDLTVLVVLARPWRTCWTWLPTPCLGATTRR